MFSCNQKYDIKLAKELCDTLSINTGTGGRLLDVESGTGTLVYECWNRGVESYGCEMNPPSHGYAGERIYRSTLGATHFPTDHFQRVIALSIPDEHPAMIDVLVEAFRVTAQDGIFYAGIPLVFYQEGVAQMIRAGFVDIKEVGKDKNRALFSGRKPLQKRVSLLLPPGVGDSYWSLVKTESFLKREGISSPVDVYVAAPRAKKYDSHARGFPFLEMVPFLHSTNEVRFNRKDPVWTEAYLQQGRSIFENFLECDYFLTWNGYLRAGKSLDEVDPDLKCNWFFPRFISVREESYRKDSISNYGDYLVLYWTFMGTNGSMLNHFTIKDIAGAVRKIVNETKLTPLLVGAIWDNDDPNIADLKRLLPKNTVDLRGKTNIEEVFGLIRGSKAVVGMNSGITIMSAVFGVKTILLYHEYLFTGTVHRDFAWNTFPPEVRRKTYFAEFADSITPNNFAARAISVINDTQYIEGKSPDQIKSLIKNHEKQSIEGCVSIRELEGSPINSEKTTIACVLKSGGDFDKDDVMRLKHMVENNTTLPYKFVCLTDMELDDSISKIPLTHNYQGVGWWSKIELFRPNIFDTKRVVYLDLDTVILDSIDPLLEIKDGFVGLKPWNSKNFKLGLFASGIICWENDNMYSFIYEEFEWEETIKSFQGDQNYLTHKLKSRGMSFKYLQDAVSGICSYKRTCRIGLPNDARIVCFHGNPRPKNVNLPWVKAAYGED